MYKMNKNKKGKHQPPRFLQRKRPRRAHPRVRFRIYSFSSFLMASTFFASSPTLTFISVSSVYIWILAFVAGLSCRMPSNPKATAKVKMKATKTSYFQ
jgi:hypothetical protein